MPFKKKSYKIISNVKLPRPPRGATHIILKCGDGRGAMVGIKDIDTLFGTMGKIHYAQMNLSKRKLIKEFDDVYTWDGVQVEEMVGVEE
tara:strand:- start:137 stop:403 length:267 start_codon:yes stop_codon:yes gene_type:complete